MEHRQRLVFTFLALMLAIFVVASWGSSYFIDWLWFSNLGFDSVFFRSLTAKWLTGLAGMLVFSVILFANLYPAAREVSFIPSQVIPFPYQRWLRPGRIALVVGGASLFLGALAGLALANEWLTFLLYAERTVFALNDPVFGEDVSFFVFTLPVLIIIQQFLLGAVMIALMGAAGIYLVTQRIHWEEKWVNIHPTARIHLAIMAGGFMLLKAAGYWLSTYRLLFSPGGVAFGAGYTEIFVQLPGLKVLAALAILSGLLAISNVFVRNYRLFLGSLGLLLVTSFALGSVVPSIVQNLVVKPNEIARETPFIERTIEFTRKAYNLDNVKEKDFPVQANLTAADISEAAGTIGNIRLWGWRESQASFQQLQGMRRYYRFNDVDIDRYRVGGSLQQVLVSAREISYDDLPGRSWINQHLKYTHGYGLVMSPASKVTSEGQPPLWIRDIPPGPAPAAPAEFQQLQVDRPEIYYGELTDVYAIVGTLEKEFDYPQGDQNAYTEYEGTGGISIGSPLQRLAFAFWTGDYNILFSRAVTGESRALIHRNIEERVRKVAPFLLYDRDPYLVLADGRLFWIIDAYTITGAYPYSEPMIMGNQRFNYIRNSVKVVIDTYNGDLAFYVADAEDPLIRSYAKVFPKLFQPLENMDPILHEHLRYPEFMFLTQMQKYAKYHMQDPAVFYNAEDLWEQPREIVGAGTDPQPMEPYYVIMQLPDAQEPEFLIMSPFNASNRPNMIAWLAARSDGENYGELLVYKFPKQELIFGPQQVEALINQQDTIAERLNLWNQQGSQVLRGNLLVIPVRNSLLYVEPIYLQSTNTKLPELRRVIVVYGDRVVMEETLDRALAVIFDGGTGIPAPDRGDGGPLQPGPGEVSGAAGGEGAETGGEADDGARVSSLLEEAARIYDEAVNAQRQGDWATYGDRIERLGRILNEIVSD